MAAILPRRAKRPVAFAVYMNNPVLVSVVVPTFNRATLLPRLLQRLATQDPIDGSYEVLVVDNASTDRTAEIVQAFTRECIRIRYLYEPRAGASHARNAGVAAARGSIFAFIDDDVLPDCTWLARLVDAFLRDPDTACVGGRIDPEWPSPPPHWLTPAHYPPLALQQHRGTGPYIDAAHASACLVTANFACRREVFDEVGGFSGDFSRDEDREFNLRLWRAGKRGRFVNDVRVVAVIQPERLTRRYHRQWYHVTGRNHARLWYREIIDSDGRLVPPLACTRVAGVPGFLLRELWSRGGHLIAALSRGDLSGAFLAECQARYLVSYIATCLTGRRPAPPGLALLTAADGRT
jgi:glycosyltransferase involved in cell wall biosynthesis